VSQPGDGDGEIGTNDTNEQEDEPMVSRRENRDEPFIQFKP
jgi:hypothetical protein